MIGERTLIMGILNVTPDSFSDAAENYDIDNALRNAESMIKAGVDIIDVGGESTRPGATSVTVEEEIERVVPVIRELVSRFSPPVSIDTTKAAVAESALEAGAEIVNDISGLRFSPEIASVIGARRAGVVVMHSLGSSLAELHTQPPIVNLIPEIAADFQRAIAVAGAHGVVKESIALDPGIGFGKTLEQNVEIISRLDLLRNEFSEYPILVGPSRKSVIGKLLEGRPVKERLHGTMAIVTAAILNGADIVRVHDVDAAVETARIADAIRGGVKSKRYANLT